MAASLRSDSGAPVSRLAPAALDFGQLLEVEAIRLALQVDHVGSRAQTPRESSGKVVWAMMS